MFNLAHATPYTTSTSLEQHRALWVAREAAMRATDPAKLCAKLTKTSQSLRNAQARGVTLNSSRGQELTDRYGELRAALQATSKGAQAWRDWCDALGFSREHDAYDNWA